MLDEVEAFAWSKELQGDRDALNDLVEAPRACGAEKRFQLGECLLDRIEIRTVGRQKPEARADAFDRGPHLRLLVHGQVVEDDDIAGAERRDEDLLDVGEKRGIVDRAVEDRGRSQPIDAEPRDNRVGLPVAARRVIAQAYAPRTPPVAAQQIRGDARFIDENVRARIVQGLGVLPPAAIGGDVRPSLLVGVYRFF